MDVAAAPNCQTPTADGWITTLKPSSCVRNWISWPSTGKCHFLAPVGSRSHTPALEWQLIFLPASTYYSYGQKLFWEVANDDIFTFRSGFASEPLYRVQYQINEITAYIGAYRWNHSPTFYPSFAPKSKIRWTVAPPIDQWRGLPLDSWAF